MQNNRSVKRTLLGLGIALVSIAYPLIVFFCTENVAPAFFSLLFIVISVAKFASSPNRQDLESLCVLGFGLVYSAALALSNSETLLRLYPVAMSFTFAGLFAFSLNKPESLIEQFAKLSGKTMTPNAKRYTRKLTLVWAVLLVINGLVALYLSLFASLKSWALYCGLLSYVIFAAVFAIEFAYRQHYIKKYGE